MSGQPYQFIRQSDLEALSKVRSEQGPVFSLFLDLRSEDTLNRFEKLLEQVEQQKKPDQASPAYREQWSKEASRIRRWLETEHTNQGEGLVILSSSAVDLWQAFLLPVPVFDRLVTNDRPYVRPLEILLCEAGCTLAVLIDPATARLVEVTLGNAVEVTHTQAVPVTGGDDPGGAREHARSVAEQAEAAWREANCTRLVIGGDDEALSDLRDALPETLRGHLAGEVHLSPAAELEDIAAQVQEVEAEREQQLEAQRVQEFITSVQDSRAAVSGLEQTLLKVKEKKVRLLLVEEDLHQEGVECPNCGFLGPTVQKRCPVCWVGLRYEPDIVETALKCVLDQGGEIEILRSQESRHALEPYGGIGGLLQDAGKPAPEKDSSNQSIIAKDGEINHDALHDEAIEESFPASDPPGWSH